MTGGGRGVGRAIAERLLADGYAVVVLEHDPAAVAWTGSHPAGDRLRTVVGDAGDEDVAARAADVAEQAAPLAGWVNNAAVFPEASADRQHGARRAGRPDRAQRAPRRRRRRHGGTQVPGRRYGRGDRARLLPPGPPGRCPVPCRTRWRRRPSRG
ncbi:SDR family NAD(P)-dependent oxidoreductase [Micromonospora olivasterospora]|uniref:SDR family NAD(P)-dependent oxidoreductase n=1 Tax=Micromonospora olivasterospora TaxID=1880 RepID=UPI001FE2E80A|nr:SDR family NAD(P)-dependent oxidoreductase [Micromonospora olivasterospora]